jgi:hypothetical protein
MRAGVAASVGAVDRDEARDAARRELAKPRYHHDDQPWPVRVLTYLWHRLHDLFDTAARHSPGGAAGVVAIVVLLVAVAAVARWRLGPWDRDIRAAGTVLDARVPRTAAEHRALAEAAAARADWATAVVERVRAIARDLVDRGVLDERPGRTADELAAEVSIAVPSVRAETLRAADAFDRVVYGRRPVDADDYGAATAADQAARRLRSPVGVE